MSMQFTLEHPRNKTQHQLEYPTAHRPATSDLSATNGGPSTESGSASEDFDTKAHLMVDSVVNDYLK